MLTHFQNSFTGTLSSKFRKHITNPLTATLPCD